MSHALDVDLIILEPRTNSVKDDVYLGKTSGKIIKRTQIPALIVPEGCTYSLFYPWARELGKPAWV